MRRILSLLALAALALTVASCGNQGKTLAKVGDQKITLAQFEDAFRMPMMADSEAVMSSKRRLLDQMAEQKMLVLEALAKGLGNDPKLQKEMENARKQILLGQLYRQEILDKSQPSEGEIKDFYQKMSTEVKAGHILVKTEEEAKEIYKQLKGGASFGQLAGEKSLDPGSKGRGGDLGWFGWGRMVQAFQQAAFKLKPGQTSKPVKTPFGYHIIRVDSVRPAEVQPYDQMKEKIRQQLSFTKPREMATEYVDKVKASARIKFEKKALDLLAAKQPGVQGPAPLPPLSGDEGKQTLVRYNGGSWTVEVFYDRLNRMFGGNADLRSEENLKQQVEAMLVEDLLLKRAESMGVDRNPKVKVQLERSRDDLLASAFYQSEIGPLVKVTPEEVKDFYSKNRKQFYQPARVMVNQITLKTEAEAEAVYKQLQGGADFGALAAEKSTDWTRSSRGVLGELTQNDPRFPEASRAAYDLPLNRVSRPFANKEGFSLVKVTNRIPGRQLTYDEAKQGIEQNMVQMQEQNLFEKMIEGLKAKYPVTIDEVLLKKAGNQQPPTENKK